MNGWNAFIDNWNRFFTTCGTIGDFIGRCTTEQGYFINTIQGITHELVLPILLALIILRFLGFREVTKYFALVLVIAVLVAIL